MFDDIDNILGSLGSEYGVGDDGFNSLDGLAREYGVTNDPPPKKPKGEVDSILKRMRGSVVTQESGGDPDVQNPRTKATGLFQVMPANIPAWTRKYYKRTLGPSEYARNTEAQEAVFRGEMGRYLKKALKRAPDEDTAIRMAAAAWYGGERAMHRYDDGKRFRANEPSFREYTTSILNRMKKSGDAPVGSSGIPIGLPDDPVATITAGSPDDLPLYPNRSGGLDPELYPQRLGQMAQGEAQNMLNQEGQKFIEGVTNNGTPLETGPQGLLQLPEGVAPTPQQGEFRIDGPEAARAAYEDFLKQTGMKPGLESLTEFNTVQQTLGAMKLPTQEEAQAWLDAPTPQRPQGLATGEGGLIDVAQPGLGGSVASTKPFETRFAVSGDVVRDKDELASRASNSIGVDYDLIRDYLNEGGGLVGDDKSKTQFTPAMAAKMKGQEKGFGLDAAAVEDLQAMQARRNRMKARTAELSQTMNLAEPPEAASIQAAMDEGVLNFRKGRELYHQARNDYIDWLVRKGLGDEKEIREAFNLPVAEQGAFFSALESAGRAVGLGSLIDAYRADNPNRIQREINEEIKKYGSLAKSNQRAARIDKEYGTIGDSTRPMARPTEFALNLFRKIAELPAEVSTLAGMGADAMSPAGINPKDNPFVQFSKDWKKRIDDGRNKDLADELIVRDVADATAQVLEQALMVPFTGGASVVLPIGQAAGGQYEQAAEEGDNRNQRLFRAAIGGLAGAPGAILHLQYLKALSPAAKLNFIDDVTEKLASGLAQKMTANEARQATLTTINGMLMKGAGGGFTEYSQERLEDVTNKGIAKAVGSKGSENVTWAQIFRPSLREEQGYQAAGITGILGGGFNAAAVASLPDTELAKTETELERAINDGLVKPEEAQAIQEVVNAERETRAAVPAERIPGVYQAGDVLTSKAGGQFTVVEDLGATKVKVMDSKGKILTRNKNRLKLTEEEQGAPDAPATAPETAKVIPAPTPEKIDEFVKEWELGEDDFESPESPATVAPVSGTAGPTLATQAPPGTPTTQTTVEAPSLTKGATVQFVDEATGQTVSGTISGIGGASGLVEVEVDGRPVIVAADVVQPVSDVAMAAEDIEAAPLGRGDAVYVGQDTSKIGEVLGTRKGRTGELEALVRFPGEQGFRTVPLSDLNTAEDNLTEGDPVYINENNELRPGQLTTIDPQRGRGRVEFEDGSHQTVPLRKLILGQRPVDTSQGFVVIADTDRESERERVYTTLEDAKAAAARMANIIPIDDVIIVRSKADNDRYAQELAPLSQDELREKYHTITAPADLAVVHGEQMVQKHGRVEIPMIRADIPRVRKGVALQQPTAQAVLDLNELGIETTSSGWHSGLGKWAIIAYKPDPETFQVLQSLGSQVGLAVDDHWRQSDYMVLSPPGVPVGHQQKAEAAFTRFVNKIKDLREAAESEETEKERAAASASPKTQRRITEPWRAGNAVQAKTKEGPFVYGRILAIKDEEAMVEFHVGAKTVKRSVKLKQLRPVATSFKVDNIVTAPDLTGAERPARILEIDPPEAENRRAMIEFAHDTTQPFMIVNVMDLVPSSVGDVAMATEGEAALSSPLARSMAARRGESGRTPAVIAAQFGVSPTDVEAAPEIGEAGDFGWIKYGMSQFLLDPENEEHLEETAAALLGEDDMVFEMIAGDYKDRRDVMSAILDVLANQQGVDRSSQMTPEQWQDAIDQNVGVLRPEVLKAMDAAAASTAQWHQNILGFIADPELQKILADAHAGRQIDIKKIVAIGRKYDKRSPAGTRLSPRVNEGLSDDIIKRSFARAVSGRLPNDAVRRSAQRAAQGPRGEGEAERDITTSSEDIKPQSVWQKLKDAITNPTPSQALKDRRATTMRIDPEVAREVLYGMGPLSVVDGGEVNLEVDEGYQPGELSPEYTPSAIEIPLDPSEFHMADAWHGTPHAIHESPEGRFSLKYLGTGEGAQAFGWGLYFASREKVADFYRKNLSGPTKVTYKNRPRHSNVRTRTPEEYVPEEVALDIENGYSFDEALQRTKSMYEELVQTQLVMLGRYRQEGQAEMERATSGAVEVAHRALVTLDTLQESDFEIKRSGFKYKVEIKPTEDLFLLWETPLSEQSEKVRAALLDPISDVWKAGRAKMTGEDVYKLKVQMFTRSGHPNPQQAASQDLKEAGIRGIKYPEGSLQNKRTDNFNYVVFADEDVEIKEIHQARATGLQIVQSYDNVQIGGLAMFHKARVEKDGTFSTSAQGQQILRRAMEWAWKKPYTPFFGIYFRSDQTGPIATALDEMAKAEDEAGARETAQRLRAFAKTFKESISPIYNDAVMTIDLGAAFAPALRNVKVEEMAHRADHRARQREALDTSPFESNLGYQKAIGHLATGAYQGASPRLLHNEVIAKIFRPDALQNLNITEGERSEIERLYLKQLLEADIPPQAIIHFFEGVDSVYAKNFTETAKVIREAQARAAKRAFNQTERTAAAISQPFQGGAANSGLATPALSGSDIGGVDGRSGQPVSGGLDPQEEASLAAEDSGPTTKPRIMYRGRDVREEGLLMPAVLSNIIRDIQDGKDKVAAIDQAIEDLAKYIGAYGPGFKALDGEMEALQELKANPDQLEVIAPPDDIQDLGDAVMSAEDIEPITEDELTPESLKQRTDDWIMKHAPDFLTKGGREGATEFAANTFRSGVLAAWGPIKTNLFGNPINVLSEQFTAMFGAAIAYSRHKALGHDTKYGAAGRTPGDIAAAFSHALTEGILGEKGMIAAITQGVEDAPELARYDMEHLEEQVEGEGLAQLQALPTVLKAPYIVARSINEGVKRTFVGIDKPFSKFGEGAQAHAQARKVAKQLQEDGVVDSWKEAIRIATANPAPVDQEVAQLVGQFGTFQNPNLVTGVLGHARTALATGSWMRKDATPGERAAGELLGKIGYLALSSEVPFVRTVSNIGLRTAEYAFPPYAAFKAAMLYRIAGGNALPIPQAVENLLGPEWAGRFRNLNQRVHDLTELDKKWAAQDKKTRALRQEETRTIKRPILKQIKEINEALEKSERARKRADAAVRSSNLTPEQKLEKLNANEEKLAAHQLRAGLRIKMLEDKKASALKYLADQQKAENEERRIERENLRAQREEFHTKREYIEADLTLARGGIGALVLLPFMAGLISGLFDAMGEIDYDDEPEKWQAARKAGIPEGSVKVPGTTYRWPMHLAPITRALSIYTTAYDQAQRPGTGAQKTAAIGEALYSRGLLTLNPYTDPTFRREGGPLSPEAFGERAVKFTPGFNIGLLREIGEVVDEQPRTTRNQGFMGPIWRQIPPGLGIGRENLPVSKNPLGKRGGWDRRFGRLVIEPPRGSFEVKPQKTLPMKSLVPKKKK